MIDEVWAGATIVILDRGVPVATLEPVAKLEDPSGRMQRFVRAGLATPPKAPLPLHLLDKPLPKTLDGSTVVEALLEERRTLPVRFWDSSALVPLLIEEPMSAALRAEYRADQHIAAWWATLVECVAAIARRERSRCVSPAATAAALSRLREFSDAWHEIGPTPPLRRYAQRLLRVHQLRAADALQLAAAITGSEGRPSSMPFVILDSQLALAAEREGVTVIVPA